MKSKSTTQNNGFLNRLLKGSLILLCLETISSRLISFFKASVFSYMFSGGENSDKLLENGLIANSVYKTNIKKCVVKKLKATIALSIEHSFIYKKYREIINKVIYTPTNTFGAFIATLGIYICLVYFVKLYGVGNETTEDISSLVIGGSLVLFSFPVAFSKKPLIQTLYESVFIRNMLKGVIDLEFFAGEKRRGAAGIALIIGSLLGVLSFFCSEIKILLLIIALIYVLLCLYSPELGLLISIAVFPFVNKNVLCLLILSAFVSYIIKVLRGKRNLHINASNIFALMLCVCFMFELFGGGENALFALSVVAVFLMSANLLVTQKLLNKASNALSVSVGIAVAFYVAQVFIAALNGGSWFSALVNSHSVFESSKQFSVYILLMIPFVYSKTGGYLFFSKAYSYLLVMVCIIYSVLNGDTICAFLAAAASTLLLAVRSRHIFRPFILSFGIPVGGLYFSKVPISFGDMGFYTKLSSWLEAIKATSGNFFLGTGMSADSVALVFAGDSHSMYLQTFLECGLFGFVLLILALAFAVQRIYAHLTPVGTANRSITSAAAASAVIGLLIGLGTNLWADKDICYILWLCLGLACAAFEIRKESRRGSDDEQNEQ